MARLLVALSVLLAASACEPTPCVGDSCNCYGDPEAEHANAGCADCTPEATCETLRDRVRACGESFEGSLSDCESRIRATHDCFEGVEAIDCGELSAGCPSHDAACYAGLVISGRTGGDVSPVPGGDENPDAPSCQTDADCGPDGRCFAGSCDPPLGTPCVDPFDCGSRSCQPVPGTTERICTELCLESCEPGSICGCPAGFSCSSHFCFPT